MAQARKTPNAAKQRFVLILVVIAVAGAAGLGWVATRPKGSSAVAIDPNLPPAKAEGYLIGREDAPVKIIEFADFECPACGQFATLTEPDVRARLVATGLASVRFFDFPLAMHKNTWSASNAAACADDQGKFWEMHDRLFYAQDLWNGGATSSPEKKMKAFAEELGLDKKKFNECFDSQVHYPRIKASGEGPAFHLALLGLVSERNWSLSGRGRRDSLPRPAAVDLQLQREAQDRADQDDDPQRERAFDCG